MTATQEKRIAEIRERLSDAGVLMPRHDGVESLSDRMREDFEWLLFVVNKLDRDAKREMTFGLPTDESPERNMVCDLLVEELLDVGETAYHAGERITVNLRDEGEVRGLLRFMTAVDGEGRDGPYGERKQALWRNLGRVLAGLALSSTARKEDDNG